MITDPHSPTVQLCIEGTRAEYAGQPQRAAALYQKAWEIAGNDYEACVAAHYVARFQETPEEVLAWNLKALRRAEAAGDEAVQEFYPSLYLSLGQAYELVGDMQEAQRYYDQAAALGFPHQGTSTRP